MPRERRRFRTRMHTRDCSLSMFMTRLMRLRRDASISDLTMTAEEDLLRVKYGFDMPGLLDAVMKLRGIPDSWRNRYHV